MIKASMVALAATLCCIASPGFGMTPYAAKAAAERLLGADDAERKRDDLRFARRMNASGVVAGSFADSIAAAGVPRAALIETLRAFRTALDLERDVRNGDRFWVRYEREYTLEGNPVGIGRVLWAELRSSKKGTIAIHRFRTGKSEREPFWLATGDSTEATAMRLPLDAANISSGFGMRADPFDQPSARAMGALRGPALPPALKANPGGGPVENVNVATPLGLAIGLSPGGRTVKPPTGRGGLVMHSGVDFVADPGTPVHAAAAGVIVGAHYKGGYGNWIEIAHDGGIATVYGHLSGYAPATRAGAAVEQGQVIGYVGNTGRSTGAHLHFELVLNDRAVNPMKHLTATRTQLRGLDLERFRKVVADNLANAEREGKPR